MSEQSYDRVFLLSPEFCAVAGHLRTPDAAAPLTISGTEVAQDPGNWQVKILRNGTFRFALPFTIVP
jgi:hypothetical protein